MFYIIFVFFSFVEVSSIQIIVTFLGDLQNTHTRYVMCFLAQLSLSHTQIDLSPGQLWVAATKVAATGAVPFRLIFSPTSLIVPAYMRMNSGVYIR